MENIPEMVFVKEELIDDTDPIDEYESKLKVKCGEVFALFGGDLILVCTFCNVPHADMFLLGEHLREMHTGEFIKKDDYENEFNVDPVDPADREDSLVEKTYTTEYSKAYTKKTSVKRKGPYNCEKCEKKYKNRRNLVRHWQRTGCQPTTSEEEATDLEKFPGLRPELLTRRCSGRVYCDMCNVSYKNQRNLVRHQNKTGCRQRKRSSANIGKESGDCNSRIEPDTKIHIKIIPTSEEMNIALSNELNSSQDNELLTKVEAAEPNRGCHDYHSDYDRHADDSACSDTECIKDTLQLHPKTSQRHKCESNLNILCATCGMQFTSKIALANHQRRHKARNKGKISRTTNITESIPKNPHLFCDLCKVYFKNRESFYIHTDQHYETLPLVLQSNTDYLKCKYCSTKFNKYADRLAHEKAHDSDRPYECPYCQKGFASNISRKAHLRVHTGESPYQCDQCSKVFRDKFDLRRHVDRHLNLRKLACELCEKKFYNKHQLTLHIRTHTKERPYVCEDCGKTFVVLPQLKDHQLRHTGVKNVICKVCDRRFYSNAVLKVHMASHSDEKPFECNICGRRFSRAKAMQKHMKLHSDIKKYVCNICGKAYAQDSGLYAHKKMHAKRM